MSNKTTEIAIKRIEDIIDISLVENLAIKIWEEHYEPIIGKAQVLYMLEKFQSIKAIQQQIEKGYEYYLLNYKGNPSGYMSIQPKDNAVFLSKIYVVGKLRGKGVGKKGMQFVFGRTKNLGFHKVWLTVNKNNTSSIKAYEKMGFKITEELVMDIGNGYVMDDFKMEKHLL